MQIMLDTLKQWIDITDAEWQQFSAWCHKKQFTKGSILWEAGKIPEEVYFIEKGGVRVRVDAPDGKIHTLHFAFEGSFIADYSAFMRQQPAAQELEALEDTLCICLPRKAIEWGYATLKDGQKLGRLVAEGYFIYHDERILNQYIRTPAERYMQLSKTFPNIHNRAPQHMIASYLGITPVHLSRLKKQL